MFKRILKNSYLVLAIGILLVGFTVSVTNAAVQSNYWIQDSINSLSTNTSGGLATGDIHVAHCYIGTGTSTSCGGGGGGSGTVTSVSVVTANGFSGTVATPTVTPAITLGTTVTGVLKGDGTSISAAAAGTDYQAPITLTTTGTSGAATFIANTLNIPNYAGGVTSVFGRNGVVTAQSGDYNTSLVTENTNLYFTNARAIASTLTGYTSGAGTVSSSDSVLSAIQKLNGNTAALVTGVSSVNGSTGAVTLANLTATDATLTFSGSYNGSTARTVGINLGNGNTWSAKQIFSNGINVGANQELTQQSFIGSVTGLRLQSSTSNARSFLGVVPNGTSTNADIWAFSSSDMTTNYSALAWGYEVGSTSWGFNVVKGGTGAAHGIYINATGNASSTTSNMYFTTTGKIGVNGITAPADLFANTATGIVDSNGVGTNGSTGLVWATNAVGYAHAMFNASTSTSADGLLIKIAGSTSNQVGFAIDTGATQGSAGTNLFKVLGNGNVGVAIGATTPTAKIHLGAGTATASTAPLKFTSGTNLTTAEAGAMEYDGTSLYMTNGGLQRQELVQSQQSRVSTQFDATTNTTLANITGLTSTLVAGKVYRFTATLYVTADAVGGYKTAMAGTATATSIIYDITTETNGVAPALSRQTALAGSSGGTLGTTVNITITGLITVNAAGTLTTQFAQNASNGTSSVLVGSNLLVEQLQ